MKSLFAYVIHDSSLYVAKVGTPRQPGSLQTPITQLIQGIHSRFPSESRRILRNRIFSNVEPTAFCLLTVKIAAKRLEFNPSLEIPEGMETFEIEPLHLPPRPPCSPFPYNEITQLQSITPTTQAKEAFEILESLNPPTPAQPDHPPRHEPRHKKDRPIAALLVDPQGHILGLAKNSSSTNRALHAEILVLNQAFQKTGKPIPSGSSLYSTLKPCRMCAAALFHCAQDWRHLKVIYRDFDSGPQGRSTLLDAHSPDRKRFYSEPLDRGLEIQQAFNSLQ